MAVSDPNDELARIYSSPIQKNFQRLVQDCDPSRMIDLLFANEIITLDDMDRILTLQRSESRSVAARSLFLALIQRAKSDHNFEAVDGLINSLRDVGTAGATSIAEEVSSAREHAQAELNRHRGGLGYGSTTVGVSEHIDAGGPAQLPYKDNSQFYPAPDTSNMDNQFYPAPDTSNMDMWETVIQPLQADIVDMLDPQTIGRECSARGLISTSEYHDLVSQRGMGDAMIMDRLLYHLSHTGNSGYEQFKQILTKWTLPHRFARTLQKIRQSEPRSYQSPAVPQPKPSRGIAAPVTETGSEDRSSYTIPTQSSDTSTYTPLGYSGTTVSSILQESAPKAHTKTFEDKYHSTGFEDAMLTQPTPQDIVALSDRLSEKWKKLVRRLEDARRHGQTPFSEAEIARVETSEQGDANEILIVLLNRWVDMSFEHNWQRIFKALRAINEEETGKAVFAESRRNVY